MTWWTGVAGEARADASGQLADACSPKPVWLERRGAAGPEIHDVVAGQGKACGPRLRRTEPSAFPTSF
jgi:hypothetical protein